MEFPESRPGGDRRLIASEACSAAFRWPVGARLLTPMRSLLLRNSYIQRHRTHQSGANIQTPNAQGVSSWVGRYGYFKSFNSGMSFTALGAGTERR